MPSDNDPDEREDRPRRRRDDDDYDDRPRRRPPPPAKSSAGLIIGIIAGVLLCGLVVVGLLVALLVPAMSNVRHAAARMSDQNNMKQIGLAMHNQHSANDKFIAPYAQNNMGKANTGLSWRVGILPYIEQDAVYRLFNMNESWDSAANKRLSDTIIKTYSTPMDDKQPTVNTPYRVFYGGGAMFEEDGKGIDIRDIPDGTANTIMVVHAAEEVPWAAPRELRYDPNGPLPAFGRNTKPRGFNVTMADGSVRFVTDKVSEQTLRAVITKKGGERVDLDW